MPRLNLRRTLLAVLLALTATLPSGGGGAAAGRPLRYLGGDPGTFDPAYISDAGDVQLVLQLYAGLTRLDDAGTPYPSLAASWTVGDAGRTYTFRLRSGLTFSDGSPLDARDVRRSWLRLLDPATRSTAPDVLSVIQNATERLAGRATESQVGIDAPEATTLVVHLAHPAAYFTSITATPATFVVPRNAQPTPTWQRAGSFVGSGPYIVASQAQTDLVLRGNPRYVGGPPTIDEVQWTGHLQGDATSAFSANRLDLTEVAPWDATWIRYDRNLGPHLHPAAALSVAFFGLDTTRPPFDDVRVRRAFALALDRRRLVELSAGAAAEAANSLVPPALQPAGMPGIPTAGVAEARRLLDEAGYGDRSKLGLLRVNANGLNVGPAVAVWRRDLGVSISVETMRFADFLGQIATDAPPIFTINWIADYPSPYALYSLLLLPGAASNYGRWNDPGFVSLLQEASSAAPTAESAAYRAVEERVQDQAPVIPWSYTESSWLVRQGLRGAGKLTVGLMDFGSLSWAG